MTEGNEAGFRARMDYLSAGAAKRAPTVGERCTRVLGVVGNCWVLLAAVIMTASLDLPQSSPYYLKAKIFGIGSLLVGAGILTVALTLWFALREPKT